MSITEELRKWAKDNTLQDRVLTSYPPQHAVHGVLETLLRIADRIDAEYERKVADVRNDALYHANESDMAELGWIRLPKDRDGETIHVGDVMEFARFEIEHPVQCEVFGVGQDVFFAWCEESGYTQKDAVAHRHVKPDTWEHIINDAFGATTMNDEVRASFVARCKALAGEGDGKPLRHLASHEALRARIDECCAKIEAASENAKLRKMLRDMRYCIKRNHRCDDCDFNVGTDCLLFVNINKRMRELGVEEN